MEMGKCKAKEKEERGRKSSEAGGRTTKCSGRPSFSKGGTHRATGLDCTWRNVELQSRTFLRSVERSLL